MEYRDGRCISTFLEQISISVYIDSIELLSCNHVIVPSRPGVSNQRLKQFWMNPPIDPAPIGSHIRIRSFGAFHPVKN